MATISTDRLGDALERAYPELATVRAASSTPVYLVGGAVRDLLLGRGRADIDLVVVGDAGALAAGLGAEPVEHERFATAKALLDSHEVDIATARAETYSAPGALPDVEPAGDVETDLRRRDFTINAMAVPLAEPGRLIDPYGGLPDLEAGLLRTLHPGSLEDDPTRALRAARYAARYDFEPEAETARQLRDADLETVSADRRRAELLLIAAEPTAPRAFELLAEWGLVGLREGGVELAQRARDLLASFPWRGEVEQAPALLAAALGPSGRETELATQSPESPSRAVELAGGHDRVELLLARALGAEWLDRYIGEWRHVRLEIDGEDLIRAGIPEGPRIGRGLSAALQHKLDGKVAGREQELAAALEAAEGSE